MPNIKYWFCFYLAFAFLYENILCICLFYEWNEMVFTRNKNIMWKKVWLILLDFSKQLVEINSITKLSCRNAVLRVLSYDIGGENSLVQMPFSNDFNPDVCTQKPFSIYSLSYSGSKQLHIVNILLNFIIFTAGFFVCFKFSL